MLDERFLERMKELLKDEYDSFLKSYDNVSLRALRVNKLFFNPEDFSNKFPFKVKKMELENDCFYLETDEKVGRHPFHHAGLIYLQDPSAMLPAYSYKFKNGINILDLCAAPGGKTGQLAINNSEGLVVSNEINKSRSKILFSNIERLGLKNVVITSSDSADLRKKLSGFFDLILVDAPCSGEGMFRKDQVAIDEWSPELVTLNCNRQKEILDNAYRMLKKDGILIYSTCTFSTLENEENVKYMIDNYKMSLVKPTEETIKLTTFYEDENMRRSYPHLQSGEGQFFAILQKNEEEECTYKYAKYQNKIDHNVTDFIEKYLDKPLIDIKCINNKYYHVPTLVDFSKIDIVNYGVLLGEVIKNRFVPHHNFYKAFGLDFKNKLSLELDDPRLNKYLRGEEITADIEDGFGVILLYGMPLGGFKAVNGILKNYYPKGLRNF